jgi:hypothetical protein
MELGVGGPSTKQSSKKDAQQKMKPEQGTILRAAK